MAEMSYTIQDNSRQFLNASESAKKNALTKIALALDSAAAAATPVDTGMLRNSRGYKVGSEEVTYGYTADYATFVELGTRKMKAQPFLKPAIEKSMSSFQSIIESAYKNA